MEGDEGRPTLTPKKGGMASLKKKEKEETVLNKRPHERSEAQ